MVAIGRTSSRKANRKRETHLVSARPSGGSVGYRIDWPEVSLGYITDTTCQDDSEYWSYLKGVDWLIHECNFTDNEKNSRCLPVTVGPRLF